MQAVEFEADIQNGMIPLPGELRLIQKGHLRIIALFQALPGLCGDLSLAICTYTLWLADEVGRLSVTN